MPRAYSHSNYDEQAQDPGAGEWQALRGELVALLDKVESHYGPVDDEPAPPAMTGLAQRVRQLRDQVGTPEPSNRRREALRTVKRAVDRFSERDAHPAEAEEQDDLTAAIAQIRSRQGPAPMPVPARRSSDMPEIRELGSLVGGMSQRLERLEGELKSQRSNGEHVREVASQVEQLTQVVELLAGAVGETGQVKRLESQIAALGAMIEEGPRNDLHVINARLDDVSTTVGKLAELQAQQMEREIAREERRGLEGKSEVAALAPAMQSIEASMRNVYDRIDVIERSVSLSSGEFERLTSDMAALTAAVQNNSSNPGDLAERIEELVARLDTSAGGNADVAALTAEMGVLRQAVLSGMEPRFAKIEEQIEALSERISPVDSKAVENQLKLLMDRMDDAGAQLDGLARLYHAAEERPDMNALADLVAERTSEVFKKAPAPVAMFGPESLKSIEDRMTGLIKSAGKTPDYEQLAEIVATRTSEALRTPGASGLSDENMAVLEKRMTALFNTAGKDTAERLTRLEAVLAAKSEQAAAPAPAAKAATPAAATPAKPSQPDAEFEQALRGDVVSSGRLNAILSGLGEDRRDTMPSNPADDGPLIDPGFRDNAPVRSALAGKAIAGEAAKPLVEKPAAPKTATGFDPAQAERPPRPRSSFAELDTDPFAPAPKPAQDKLAEPAAAASSTSTFVAAARRAQRAKQEEVQATENNSIIARALSRVRNRKDAGAETADAKPVAAPKVDAKSDPKPSRRDRKAEKAAKREPVLAPEQKAPALPEAKDDGPGFLTRHRRPLLLAATLVAVSMLALNLVMQRMNAASPAPEPAPAAAAPAAQNNPPPSDDVSSVVPPRVIDMVDVTATGSINPGEPMSFGHATTLATSTPIPPALTASNGRISAATSGSGAAPSTTPDVTGSITPAAASTATDETFDLPPEAVGPQELREAAAAGNATAQFEVAAILGEGRVLEKNPEEAARWYERSAAQGFVPAQYRLGNLFEMGAGVEKDLEQARLWYQRAAEAGNRMAMHNLAALYAGGEMGEQQFELAAEWFARAAERGMTDSQFNLGMLHARGLGVEQDFEQSFKWFSLAARNGDQDAAKARDDIAKSLSAEAVSRINAQIESWKMQPVELAANFAPIGTWSSTFDPGQPISSRDVIAKVQSALSKLGFDVGTPDGVAGPKTSDAIRSFEKATGMSESGVINPRLLAVLGSQPV
ncbi:localization factor PodJL [Devosia lucknowensis]|uniref:Localization factor PodJL n=1 Tax=Devosia lucknowensis TaxID=1096929 RepID=A0A1Y6E6H1_9HYPH|nr:SEL1-like repeat protein [Devosia lucknowensis]SMQ58209.1 localization factor PodJL [Devosia lucknowensis]